MALHHPSELAAEYFLHKKSLRMKHPESKSMIFDANYKRSFGGTQQSQVLSHTSGGSLKAQATKPPTRKSSRELAPASEIQTQESQTMILNLAKQIGKLEMQLLISSKLLEDNGVQIPSTLLATSSNSSDKTLLNSRGSLGGQNQSNARINMTISSEPFQKIVRKRPLASKYKGSTSQRESVNSGFELQHSSSGQDLGRAEIDRLSKGFRGPIILDKKQPVALSPKFAFLSDLSPEGKREKEFTTSHQEYNLKYFIDPAKFPKRSSKTKVVEVWTKKKIPNETPSSLGLSASQAGPSFSVLDSTTKARGHPRKRSKTRILSQSQGSNKEETNVFEKPSANPVNKVKKLNRLSLLSSGKRKPEKLPDTEKPSFQTSQSTPTQDIRPFLAGYDVSAELKDTIFQLLTGSKMNLEAKSVTPKSKDERKVRQITDNLVNHLKTPKGQLDNQSIACQSQPFPIGSHGILDLPQQESRILSPLKSVSPILRPSQTSFIRPIIPGETIYEFTHQYEAPGSEFHASKFKNEFLPTSISSSGLNPVILPSGSHFLTPQIQSPSGMFPGSKLFSANPPLQNQPNLKSESQATHGIPRSSKISSFDRDQGNNKGHFDAPLFQINCSAEKDEVFLKPEAAQSFFQTVPATREPHRNPPRVLVTSPGKSSPLNSNRLEFNLTPSGKEENNYPVTKLHLSVAQLQPLVIGVPREPQENELEGGDNSYQHYDLSSEGGKQEKWPNHVGAHHSDQVWQSQKQQRGAAPKLGAAQQTTSHHQRYSSNLTDTEDIDLRNVLSIPPSIQMQGVTASRVDGLANTQQDDFLETRKEREDLALNLSVDRSSLEFNNHFGRKSSAPVTSKQNTNKREALSTKTSKPLPENTKNTVCRIGIQKIEAKPVASAKELYSSQPGFKTAHTKQNQGATIINNQPSSKKNLLDEAKVTKGPSNSVHVAKIEAQMNQANASSAKRGSENPRELRRSNTDAKSYTPTSYKKDWKPLTSIIKTNEFKVPEERSVAKTVPNLNEFKGSFGSTGPLSTDHQNTQTAPGFLNNLKKPLIGANQKSNSKTSPVLVKKETGESLPPEEQIIEKGMSSPTQRSQSKLDANMLASAGRGTATKPPVSPTKQVAAKVNSFRKKPQQTQSKEPENVGGMVGKAPATLTQIDTSNFSPQQGTPLTRVQSMPKMLYQFDNSDEEHEIEESAATLKTKSRGNQNTPHGNPRSWEQFTDFKLRTNQVPEQGSSGKRQGSEVSEQKSFFVPEQHGKFSQQLESIHLHNPNVRIPDSTSFRNMTVSSHTFNSRGLNQSEAEEILGSQDRLTFQSKGHLGMVEQLDSRQRAGSEIFQRDLAESAGAALPSKKSPNFADPDGPKHSPPTAPPKAAKSPKVLNFDRRPKNTLSSAQELPQ